jgi:putative Holliday junction resolvase
VRIVGLDVGARRIGVAISDATGVLARPLDVIQVSRLDAAAVTRVVDRIRDLRDEEDGVARLVVGLPRHLDGTPNAMTESVSQFARDVADRVGLPLALQDERLSSREAESRLARREKDWRMRKARLDAAAAAVILQDYLDEHAAGSVVRSDVEP